MIRMVIFDLDGTIYDYEKCNRIAESYLFEEMKEKLCVSLNEARELLMIAKHDVKERLGDVAASHNRLLYMQAICERKKVNPLKYAMRFYDTYWECMLSHMVPYPYVRPLFTLLHKKNIKIGLLTDLTAHIQYRKIDRLGISSYIDLITTSEEAGAEKPSYEIFRCLLLKIQYPANETLMIGDNRKKDVEGAKNMGMNAILYHKDMDIIKKVGEMI